MKFLMPSVIASIAVAAALRAPAQVVAEPVTVFAAASLSTALQDVAEAWRDDTGHDVVMSFAGSSALANQIMQGAPADIFISSSSAWMDAVQAAGDLAPSGRRVILLNSLVLIAHGADRDPVTMDNTLDLAGLLGEGHLAMALVDAVPAGLYGKAALQSLGLWESVAAQIAQGDNVRAALSLVARNEAPLGIVYATDAVAQDNVTVIGTFPEDSHPPITYPAAQTAQSQSAVAADFLDFLSSDTARAIWQAHGFGVPR